MANPHRGEVALTVGDQDYTLSFSINAICELEDALDKPVAKIAEGLQDASGVRMTVVRTVIWAALRDHHEEITLKEAGIIASQAGIQAAMAAISAAFSLAFPEAKEAANPRKAAKRR